MYKGHSGTGSRVSWDWIYSHNMLCVSCTCTTVKNSLCPIVDKYYSFDLRQFVRILLSNRTVKVCNKTPLFVLFIFSQIKILGSIMQHYVRIHWTFSIEQPDNRQIKFSSISCMINFSMRAITDNVCTQIKNFQQQRFETSVCSECKPPMSVFWVHLGAVSSL